MKKCWQQLCALLLICTMILGVPLSVGAEESLISEPVPHAVGSDLGVEDGALELPCKSAVLMEATTGTVLYRQNAAEAMPPASVTKIMTLLLVMEALDAGVIRLDSVVTVSANAASMGGSQVYLKEGEQMSLEDLLKSVVIASANDAASVIAEHIGGGSIDSFIQLMNEKSQQGYRRY